MPLDPSMTPTFSKQEVEAALIRAHWAYGAHIHQRTAEALVEALNKRSSLATAHVLFSRLFGELSGSLETYAAWAWSLRNRTDQPGSFLDNYLNYSNRDIGSFYALVRNHQGDLSDLLRLPPRDQLVELSLAHQAEVPEEDRSEILTAEDFITGLESQYVRLKASADEYFKADRVLIDTFNKTKHGAPILQLFEPDSDYEFEVVMPNPRASEEGEPPYKFAGFTIDDHEIQKLAHNIEVMTGDIADLASLTTILLESGVLFAHAEAGDASISTDPP